MIDNFLPQDVERWLSELATGAMKDPQAYELYVRAVSARLYEKYCVLKDPTLFAFGKR